MYNCNNDTFQLLQFNREHAQHNPIWYATLNHSIIALIHADLKYLVDLFECQQVNTQLHIVGGRSCALDEDINRGLQGIRKPVKITGQTTDHRAKSIHCDIVNRMFSIECCRRLCFYLLMQCIHPQSSLLSSIEATICHAPNNINMIEGCDDHRSSAVVAGWRWCGWRQSVR